jgi:hypothetical protein
VRQDEAESGRIDRLIGQFLVANSRAAGLFRVDMHMRADGGVAVVWKKVNEWRAWAELSEGCYMLRSNVADWDAEQL